MYIKLNVAGPVGGDRDSRTLLIPKDGISYLFPYKDSSSYTVVGLPSMGTEFVIEKGISDLLEELPSYYKQLGVLADGTIFNLAKVEYAEEDLTKSPVTTTIHYGGGLSLEVEMESELVLEGIDLHRQLNAELTKNV